MTSLYQEAQQALQELPVRPSKKLGQHFLIHRNVIEGIVKLLQLTPDEEVLEIGPGLGFLTRRLVEQARHVWAVEVDSFLVNWLRKTPWANRPDLCLVQDDILNVDFSVLLPNHKIKLAGNLPYNISTPVLFRLIEERERFSLVVLMLQREVANRIAASPGTKAYGGLSVWWQIHGEILNRMPVSPEAFFPRPKVQSMVLQMRFFSQPLAAAGDLPLLKKVVRAAFGHRRKTLGNAFQELFPGKKRELEQLLRAHAIDPQRRGETFDVGEFIHLAQLLQDEGFRDLNA
jgi:16S rRNA (adenine1518-N6/adenine1519-N6)-dimethyltransferase